MFGLLEHESFVPAIHRALVGELERTDVQLGEGAERTTAELLEKQLLLHAD